MSAFKQLARLAEQARQRAGGPGGPSGPSGKLGFGLLGGIAALWVGYDSLFTVQGGHRGVMFNRVTGVRDTIYSEGTHFRIPFIETPTIFDIRTKPKIIRSPTGTKDLQTVDITLRLLYKPEINALPKILT